MSAVVATGPLAEGCACCGRDADVHDRELMHKFDRPAKPNTREQLRDALAERLRKINGLAATWSTDGSKGEFRLSAEQHREYQRVITEARQIREMLDAAESVADVETIEVRTHASAHPVRVIEVDRTPSAPPPPPRPIPPEVWAEAEARKAEEDRLERLRQVRKRCETAAASIDRWAEQHAPHTVKRWHRWWYARWLVEQWDAENAAAVAARHVLADELRDRAALPDDLLEWLLAEGWTPPEVEQWHYLD